MQRTPAGLEKPSMTGMPGIGELMEGAMQQAAQWSRQCIDYCRAARSQGPAQPVKYKV
jgi:hypothetical protein